MFYAYKKNIMPKMKYAKHVMPNKIVTFKMMLLVFTYYR